MVVAQFGVLHNLRLPQIQSVHPSCPSHRLPGQLDGGFALASSRHAGCGHGKRKEGRIRRSPERNSIEISKLGLVKNKQQNESNKTGLEMRGLLQSQRIYEASQYEFISKGIHLYTVTFDGT